MELNTYVIIKIILKKNFENTKDIILPDNRTIRREKPNKLKENHLNIIQNLNISVPNKNWFISNIKVCRNIKIRIGISKSKMDLQKGTTTMVIIF